MNMARYYRKKRYQKGSSFTLSSEANKLSKDASKAHKAVSRGRI